MVLMKAQSRRLSRAIGTETKRKRMFNLLPIGHGMHCSGKMHRIGVTNEQIYNSISVCFIDFWILEGIINNFAQN